MSKNKRRSNETVDAHDATEAKPEELVTLFGVALVDRKFMPVKVTVPIEETLKIAEPLNYMENAYDIAESNMEDEGIRRASDRYKRVEG